MVSASVPLILVGIDSSVIARDYVEGMWMILQQEKPEDFVLATGETHSVREFVEKSFAHVGVKLRWEGEDIDEVGIDVDTGKVVVRVDPKYFRPAEVECVDLPFATGICANYCFQASSTVTPPRLSAFWVGSVASTSTLSSPRWSKLTSRLLLA